MNNQEIIGLDEVQEQEYIGQSLPSTLEFLSRHTRIKSIWSEYYRLHGVQYKGGSPDFTKHILEG